MEFNRGLVFWGVALITAGAVALAIQAGMVDEATARQAWRFWPVVLIAIGLAVILARTPFALVGTLVAAIVVGSIGGTLAAGWPEGFGCGGETTESVTDEGTFDDGASVEIDLNCGDVAVTTASGDSWSVDAGYAGDAEPRIIADGESLRVESGDQGGIFGFSEAQQDWQVTLPTDVTLSLSVSANAGSSTLDLDDATLDELGVDVNAGSVELRLPGAEVGELSVDANAGSVTLEVDGDTTVSGSIEMNAGSMDVCVPEGVALAITLSDDNITFSHNLDESGLTRQGDTWRIGDGAAAVSLQVDGNAASFTLNPEDGCS